MRIGVVGAGIIGLAVARRLAELRPDATVTVLEKEDRLAAAPERPQLRRRPRRDLLPPRQPLKASVHARQAAAARLTAPSGRSPYERGAASWSSRSTPTELAAARRAGADGHRERRTRAAAARRCAGCARSSRTRRGSRRCTRPRPRSPTIGAVAQRGSPTTSRRGWWDRAARHRGRAAPVRRRRGASRRRGRPAAVRPADRVRRAAAATGSRGRSRARPEPADRPVPRRVPRSSARRARAWCAASSTRCPDPALPVPRRPLHAARRRRLDAGRTPCSRFAREGYRRRDVRLADVADTLAWPGFWRLARRHWRTGARRAARVAVESTRSSAPRSATSPRSGCADVVAAPAGVRAQAVEPTARSSTTSGSAAAARSPAVRNAPSPAATSSLAIAEHIVERR